QPQGAGHGGGEKEQRNTHLARRRNRKPSMVVDHERSRVLTAGKPPTCPMSDGWNAETVMVVPFLYIHGTPRVDIERAGERERNFARLVARVSIDNTFGLTLSREEEIGLKSDQNTRA